MERWTLGGPDSVTVDQVTELKVKLVAGHVDVMTTDGPPRIEVHELTGDPVVVTSDDGRLTVGYEDLGGVFDFDGRLAKETLTGLGEALRDLFENGRTSRTEEWVRQFPWSGRKRHAVVSIAVPRQCRVDLNVVSATAVAAGIDGSTTVKSVSGGVTLDGLSGEVDAHTVSGDLEAQLLSGRLSFVTVSGDLTVAEAASDRVEGRTVSGDLLADLDLGPDGRLSFSTVSGDVTARLAADTDARVEVTSTSGDMTSGFDELQRERKPGKKRIHGTLGGGHGRVEVHTVSGDVHLLARKKPSTTAAAAGGQDQ
ncbi:MAG: DUF4097 family beta strand repeat protein [Streptosporangiales bacterium]|nr:DUF4097 family beta strand repeat protein [Streptosporangiales bacterium]